MGAGASVNGVPASAGLTGTMSTFKEHVAAYFKLPTPDKGLQTNSLLTAIEELAGEAAKHASIDTLAKRRFLKGESDEFTRLKTLLSFFFMIHQKMRKYDDRYDTLFATVAQRVTGRIQLPGSLNFVSWNYDSQIEMALCQLMGVADIESLAEVISVFPPKLKELTESPETRLIKLNGTATLFRDAITPINMTRRLLSPLTREDLDSWGKMYSEIENGSKDLRPQIHFAWEEPEGGIRKRAMELAAVTQVLVVIGYSFPTFNRGVDREFLKALKGKKVYVQDLEVGVIDRLNALCESQLDVVHIEDVGQFYIPYEFL